MLRYCADLAKRTDARALRRFAPAKRYTLTACFLVESQKTILDHLVALHDQLLTKKMREAHHAFEERYRQLRRQYRRGLTKLIATGNTLLDPTRSPTTTLATLLEDLDVTALRAAVDICTERYQLEERGEIDALRARLMALWSPPVGVQDPNELIVNVTIKLRRDGRLAAPPFARVNGRSVAAMASRDSAVRAVLTGQPFDMLKPEHYENWKEIELMFDPKDMFRSN